MQKTELPTFSVSQYVEYINALVSLEPVLVEGEVSNFRNITGRNFSYFDIKDDNSVARCFQGFWKCKKIGLENGRKIEIFGVPTMQKNGSFVIDVIEILLQGKGALMEAYNELKIQLRKEGLFDVERKKTLPVFPEKIGLIAGKNSSAYHDVVAEITERWGGSDVFFFPCKVQGVGAKNQIVEAIRHFNQKFPVDVLIVARGGGSAEDLQAFDNEEVVREIFASKIPLISAIGHEDHWTLSDFVSDVRAKTPTKAGQLAVPDRQELKADLENSEARMLALLKSKIKNYEYSIDGQIRESKNKILNHIEDEAFRLEHDSQSMRRTLLQTFDRKFALLQQAFQALRLVNPEKVLRRGYCMIEKNGKRIRSIHQLQKGEKIRGRLHDGEFMGKIEDVMRKFT